MEIEKYPKTNKILQSYLKLKFGKVRVRCTYWINKPDKKIRGPYSGKGTPSQIVNVAKHLAKKEGLKLEKMNPEESFSFLKRKRIGVDCSGFAYNLANSLDRELGRGGLAHLGPARRCNTDCLTNTSITREIKVEDIKAGDLVRMLGGKHALFVVDKASGFIVYAHSSGRLSEINGVHLGRIKIVKPQKDLSFQVWLEKTRKGENFGKKYFDTGKGDSIRRFKWW